MRFELRHFVLGQVAILLLLAAAAAQAQPWRGATAVEIRVEDEKGLPVAGAQVQLLYAAGDSGEGPPPVATDSRGRATVSGLAEGAWRLAVSRDGFMTYQADLAVRGGGRPEVSGATQVKVSGALRMMEVGVFRSRSVPVPTMPATPQATAVGETQPAPSAKPVQTQPRPPAPAPQAPAPAPAPAPQAAPSVPAPAEPVRQAAPAAPSTTVVRTAEDRTCVECQPGESAISTEWVVVPESGGCGDGIAARLAGGPASDLPGCHLMRIALPAGTRYIAYRFEVLDGDDSLDCPTGKDCPRSLGRWPIDPIVTRGSETTAVVAPFEPGSSQTPRRAVLTVYYTAAKKSRR